MQTMPSATVTPAQQPGAFADRKPPFSIEAEMSVLGGMFIDPDAVVRAVEILDDSMFYREAHRRLYRAMVRLWEIGQAIDPVTLSEHLKNSGDFDEVGGNVSSGLPWSRSSSSPRTTRPSPACPRVLAIWTR